MCVGKKAIAKGDEESAGCCNVYRAMIVGGFMSLLGGALGAGGALLPWLSIPAVGITVGLLTVCQDTGGVKTCGGFSSLSGLTSNARATAAAALILLGFILSLVCFLLSLINSFKCCVGPRTNTARVVLSALAFLFTVVGTIVASSALSTGGLNLADVLSSNPSLVGPGLGLSIAASLLQLIALCIVAFSVCCQPRIVIREKIVEKVVEKIVYVEKDSPHLKAGGGGSGKKGKEKEEKSPGKEGKEDTKTDNPLAASSKK